MRKQTKKMHYHPQHSLLVESSPKSFLPDKVPKPQSVHDAVLNGTNLQTDGAHENLLTDVCFFSTC